MHTFLKSVAGLLVAPLISLMGYAGYSFQPQAPVTPPAQTFGATNSIETPVALFSTSLQTAITSAATTMTLQSGTTFDGTTLASSTYSFIIDEGQADQEFVKADCTNTACTNMTRGLSALTGTSTVATNAQPHRRGQSVKITDAPLLLNLTNMLSGIDFFPHPLTYAASVATTTLQANAQNLASVNYVNGVAFSGAAVVNASTGVAGVVQLATSTSIASSSPTANGTTKLVIPASAATSTFNAATAGLVVPVTQNNGTLDGNFLPTTIPNVHTFTGTTTLATSTINGIFPYGLVAAPTYVTNLNSATTTTFAPTDFLHVVVFVNSAASAPNLCLIFNGDYVASHYSSKNSYPSGTDCTSNSQNGIRLNDGASGEYTLATLDVAGGTNTPKVISGQLMSAQGTSPLTYATSTTLYSNTAATNPPITSVTVFDAGGQNNRILAGSYIRVYADVKP